MAQWTLYTEDFTGGTFAGTEVSGGALQWLAVADDYAIEFSGDTDRIAVNLTDTYSAAFTLEFMMRWDALQGMTFPRMIAGTVEHEISAANKFFRFRWPDGGSTIFADSDNDYIVADVWHRYSITYDFTTVRFYRDGTLITSVGLAGVGQTLTWDTIANRSALDRNLKGRLDDIRIWNTCRSESDIDTHKAQRLVGDESGLVAYFKINEGAGTAVNDSVGTRHGTLTGGAWVAGSALFTPTGTYIPPAIDTTTLAVNPRIRYTYTAPTGTDVSAQYATNTSNTIAPSVWATILDDTLLTLAPAAGDYLWLRYKLTTDNALVTPTLSAVLLESDDNCVVAKISDVSYPMLNKSLRIEDTISERSTAEFVIKDVGGLWEFERGEPVEILDRYSRLAFCGVIHSSQRYRVTEGYFEHYVTCADNHYFADKRIAAQAYLATTAGDIVRDLILDYLAAEGITEGVIEAGPTVIEATFNYIPVSEAMDELATLAGYWWAIDVDKRLYFVNPDYHSLSFGMTGSEMQRGTVNVTNMNPKYRNRQYVKGGKAITSLQTEIQYGDGSKQAFAVRYPIARVPTVEVSTGGGAWTAQTIGIKGLATGFDWYWSKGDLVLAQEIADTPLAAADRVRVAYYGQWPIVTISERTDEVTRMQTLQGGSGRVEDVVQNAEVDTLEAAFQLANTNLGKYSQNSVRIQFDTLQYGLEVGRLVNIVLPDYGIDDNFLIERLEIWQDAQLVWYRAHCLEGPSEGTWQNFFAEIARRGRQQINQENIGEDEVLIISVSVSEGISWGEGTTITPLACPICGAATLAGVGTIVC